MASAAISKLHNITRNNRYTQIISKKKKSHLKPCFTPKRDHNSINKLWNEDSGFSSNQHLENPTSIINLYSTLWL